MQKIICLAGPTATGKSAAVKNLARRLPIEVINVDSATIYQGMDIGTAKPLPQEQAEIKHHLLDIRDPAQSYSAADFCNDALSLIKEITARGHIPILAGGTMMYYKALREGLHDLPQADPMLREQLDLQAQAIGWPAMHEQLQRLDPTTAQRLSPNDSQRIQRALEVIHLSGRPLSDLLAHKAEKNNDYEFVTISLEPPNRQDLHDKIEQRFRLMLAQGFVEEVRALHQRPDLHPNLPSIRCVGYRQLWSYLNAEISYGQAVKQGIAATRQLAKRQLTWLRSQPQRIVIDCFAKNVPEQVLDKMRSILADIN